MKELILDVAVEGIKESLRVVIDDFKKGLEPFIYWFHRRGLATPESCIRRGCEHYHGHSPSARMRFLSLKSGSYVELFNFGKLANKLKKQAKSPKNGEN